MTMNTINTPFGTFTRKSGTTYAFAAVVEAAQNPEEGLRVVGNRKGDIVHVEIGLVVWLVCAVGFTTFIRSLKSAQHDVAYATRRPSAVRKLR
jgi:hypothetical protein